MKAAADYEDNYQTRDDQWGFYRAVLACDCSDSRSTSAHLGSSSRFSRAAELLQEDMIRQREHTRVEEERSSVSMDEDGQGHPPEATHAQRIEPLEDRPFGGDLRLRRQLLQILQNNEQLQQSPACRSPPLVLSM